VKFHWFAEATYDDLPEVFPQRSQSGSVAHPAALIDSARVGAS
jgi:hypothetical protein